MLIQDKIYLAAIKLAQGGQSGTQSGQSGTQSGQSGTTCSQSGSGSGCIEIPSGLPGGPGSKIQSFDQVILSISKWALSIAGGLAVLMLIVGGILYLTAAGNQERIEKAKKTLKGAIIGLIIILLSAVIVFAIGNLFSA